MSGGLDAPLLDDELLDDDIECTPTGREREGVNTPRSKQDWTSPIRKVHEELTGADLVRTASTLGNECASPKHVFSPAELMISTEGNEVI
jgi:hypothetical protein